MPYCGKLSVHLTFIKLIVDFSGMRWLYRPRFHPVLGFGTGFHVFLWFLVSEGQGSIVSNAILACGSSVWPFAVMTVRLLTTIFRLRRISGLFHRLCGVMETSHYCPLSYVLFVATFKVSLQPHSSRLSARSRGYETAPIKTMGISHTRYFCMRVP